MSPELVRRIAARYATASAWERFRLRQRLRRSDFDSLLPHLPKSGNILEIGCDLGQLRWFLEASHPGLEYYGSDINQRKIALGKAAFGDKAGRLFGGEARHWKWIPAFSAIIVPDLMNTLPPAAQGKLFADACDRLPPGTGSVLLLKLGKNKRSKSPFTGLEPAVYQDWGRQRGFEGHSIGLPTAPPSRLLVFKTTHK